MGTLVDGQWRTDWYDTKAHGGEFVREKAQLRGTLIDPEAGRRETEQAVFATPHRFHLYASLACPWAHRVLIVRKIKDLAPLMDVSITSYLMGDDGWTYDTATGSTGDTLNGKALHRELYTLSNPHYTGRVTVPVLWDKQRGTIVNNESAELMRMLNTAFNSQTGNTIDLYPEPWSIEIDVMNDYIYDRINNGVYKAGFATEQAVYERHVGRLFEALDEMEERLSDQRYLMGAYITETDIRLFTTLIRFDAVYFGHFKCNVRRIADYPHLSGYVRELYQIPAIRETVAFDHIKGHYYGSHPTINPNRIVPVGPADTLDQPHGRDALDGKGFYRA